MFFYTLVLKLVYINVVAEIYNLAWKIVLLSLMTKGYKNTQNSKFTNSFSQTFIFTYKNKILVIINSAKKRQFFLVYIFMMRYKHTGHIHLKF